MVRRMRLKEAVRVEAIKRINDTNDPIAEMKLRGDISELTFTNDNMLPIFYEAIGCSLIEGVDLPKLGVRMWVDEEGKLKNDTPINLDGTMLYIKEWKANDIILGNVVFTSMRVSKDGYTEGLNEKEKKRLLLVLDFFQSARPETGFMTEVLNDH